MTKRSTIHQGSSPRSYIQYFSAHQTQDMLSQYIDMGEIDAHRAYLQGKRDGVKDLQEEVLKMAKALFGIAQQKAEYLTDELLKSAQENDIVINKFCLKIESWEKIAMLIIVDIEDYISDKIDKLYETANQLAIEHNTEKFNWEYIITYSSERISMEKIISEGYTLLYEPSTESRKTQ